MSTNEGRGLAGAPAAPSLRGDGDYTPAMPLAPLEPDPVVDAFKPGIDLTLLDANLRRTPQERVDNMIRALRVAEALRDGMEKAKQGKAT